MMSARAMTECKNSCRYAYVICEARVKPVQYKYENSPLRLLLIFQQCGQSYA